MHQSRKRVLFFVNWHYRSLSYLLPIETSKIPEKAKQRFYSLIKHGSLKIR
jgi:hypothetical protein